MLIQAVARPSLRYAEPPVAQTVTDIYIYIYTNGADNASRLVTSLPLGNDLVLVGDGVNMQQFRDGVELG